MKLRVLAGSSDPVSHRTASLSQRTRLNSITSLTQQRQITSASTRREWSQRETTENRLRCQWCLVLVSRTLLSLLSSCSHVCTFPDTDFLLKFSPNQVFRSALGLFINLLASITKAPPTAQLPLWFLYKIWHRLKNVPSVWTLRTRQQFVVRRLLQGSVRSRFNVAVFSRLSVTSCAFRRPMLANRKRACVQMADEFTIFFVLLLLHLQKRGTDCPMCIYESLLHFCSSYQSRVVCTTVPQASSDSGELFNQLPNQTCSFETFWWIHLANTKLRVWKCWGNLMQKNTIV